jgi:hypothetical protein
MAKLLVEQFGVVGLELVLGLECPRSSFAGDGGRPGFAARRQPSPCSSRPVRPPSIAGPRPFEHGLLAPDPTGEPKQRVGQPATQTGYAPCHPGDWRRLLDRPSRRYSGSPAARESPGPAFGTVPLGAGGCRSCSDRSCSFRVTGSARRARSRPRCRTAARPFRPPHGCVFRLRRRAPRTDRSSRRSPLASR